MSSPHAVLISKAARVGPPQPNFRAPSYAILLIPAACDRCGCATSTAAFWLPPGHELAHDQGPGTEPLWERSEACRLLHEVQWIDAQARSLIRSHLPALQPVALADVQAGVWAYHCEHCGAAVDPGDATETVASALAPYPGREDPRLMVLAVAEPLRALACSSSLGDLADAPLEAVRCEGAERARG